MIKRAPLSTSLALAAAAFFGAVGSPSVQEQVLNLYFARHDQTDAAQWVTNNPAAPAASPAIEKWPGFFHGP